MISKNPDYIGAWDYAYFEALKRYKEIPETGPYFHLFISQSRNGEFKNGKISGLIKDVFGDSFFDGTLSEDTIKFTKRYTFAATQNGGKREPLIYSGIRVIQDYQEFVTGMITSLSKMTPKVFIMKRFVP